MAHNRVKKYEEISKSENFSFEPHWEEFETPKKVQLSLEKLKEFAEIIRVESEKLLVEDYQLSHLHYPVFSGPIANAEGKGIG